jgi:hypothetical protein
MGIGCGWCGEFIETPYCPGDRLVGLYYCRQCEHFNLVNPDTGRVRRLRNGQESEARALAALRPHAVGEE